MNAKDKKFYHLKKYGLYVVMGSIAIIAIYLIYAPSSDDKGSGNPGEINTAIPEAKKKELQNNKMQIYYDNNREKERKERIYNEDFYQTLGDLTEDKFPNSQDHSTLNTEVQQGDNIYENTDEDLINKVNEMMEKMGSEKTKSPTSNQPGKANQYAVNYKNSNTSPKEVREEKKLTPEEEELEYREKLLEMAERQRELEAERRARNYGSIANQNKPVEIKASFYGDQYVLPGDRCMLILDEGFEYNGLEFKRNTTFFATVGLNKARVTLEIDNVNYEQIPIGQIRDGYDGAPGVYSKNAAKLWREYEQEVGNNVVRETTSEIAQEVNVPFVGGAVRALSQFFSKKSYRNKDKLLLVNNHSVIITVKE